MRRGGNVVEIELSDPIDVLEDPRKLSGHRLHLPLREAQPGELRNVQHLISVDHAPDSRCAPAWLLSQLESTPMTGETAEKFVVLSLRLLAISFAVVGILFIAVPNGVGDVISDFGDSFGSFTRAPDTEQQLWLALAFAYMVVITGICLVAQADVVRYRPLLLVLAAGKTASSLGSLGFYLFDEDVFIYLLNFLVDGFLALLALWLWSLVDRVGRPAAPG